MAVVSKAKMLRPQPRRYRQLYKPQTDQPRANEQRRPQSWERQAAKRTTRSCRRSVTGTDAPRRPSADPVRRICWGPKTRRHYCSFGKQKRGKKKQLKQNRPNLQLSEKLIHWRGRKFGLRSLRSGAMGWLGQSVVLLGQPYRYLLYCHFAPRSSL